MRPTTKECVFETDGAGASPRLARLTGRVFVFRAHELSPTRIRRVCSELDAVAMPRAGGGGLHRNAWWKRDVPWDTRLCPDVAHRIGANARPCLVDPAIDPTARSTEGAGDFGQVADLLRAQSAQF
jgi:hypothetical protein